MSQTEGEALPEAPEHNATEGGGTFYQSWKMPPLRSASALSIRRFPAASKATAWAARWL